MRSRHALAALACAAVLSMPAPGAQQGPGEQLETFVVTATREARARNELPESISLIDGRTLARAMPTHPAEVLNRAAGVHVNNLGGEGHMTSIRQPITTGGVYLYLEDGLPTRPTGFFNHNGLYEINIPQAAGVEVTKGPGSALYGSDAIGGIINSITPVPSPDTRLSGSVESGSDGWRRLLLQGSMATGQRSAGLLQLNRSDSEGFREDAGYERRSLLGRWRIALTDALDLDASATWTGVEQRGVSGLEEHDYRHDTSRNLYDGDIGFREVEALRLSAVIEWTPVPQHAITLTPYYRDNRMDLMPGWMIGYDPNVYRNAFETFGLLLKHRWRAESPGIEWISGVDTDYTPSTYRELRLAMTRDPRGEWIGARETGRVNYDFEADQRSVSPYTQVEWAATEGLRLTAGIRHDVFDVEYRDQLDTSVAQQGFSPFFRHFRPRDQQVGWEHSSPKLGLVYALTGEQSLYANWRHAFRVPTAGQLFRSGSVRDTTQLEPVQALSREVGWRGRWRALDWDLTAYDMQVQDDIVSIIEGGDRKNVNAGETSHRGLEIALDAGLGHGLEAGIAFTWTRQRYEDFAYVCGAATCNFSGFDVARAPERIGNVVLAWAPERLPRLRLEAEWETLGAYWSDETNTGRYGGHDLFNLRASWEIDADWSVFARVQNIGDTLYSTLTSNQVGNPLLEYRPGAPRSVFLGVRGAL